MLAKVFSSSIYGVDACQYYRIFKVAPSIADLIQPETITKPYRATTDSHLSACGDAQTGGLSRIEQPQTIPEAQIPLITRIWIIKAKKNKP